MVEKLRSIIKIQRVSKGISLIRIFVLRKDVVRCKKEYEKACSFCFFSVFLMQNEENL